MTKRKWLSMGSAVLVLFLAVVLLAGCAKKSPVKSETWVHREPMPTAPAPEKIPIGDREAKAAREAEDRRLQEQTLRDEAVRERRPEERRVEEDAAERARWVAVNKETAVLRELRISDIHFGLNEYKLSPEGQAILKAAAPAWLKYPDYLLVIEGHCDERGTVEYNLALGQKRAEEAAQYLIHLGVAKPRIRTISFGKEKPVDPGHDEAAWARNRRVHFVVSEPAK